jgi:hypothetical protein
MTGFEPVDWEARLRDQLAEHQRRQAAKRAERAAFAERRRAGLEARHAAKLARKPPREEEPPQ